MAAKKAMVHKKTISQNLLIKIFLLIFGRIFTFIVFEIMRPLIWKLNGRILP